MVLYNAEDTLVVVACTFGCEVDNDTGCRVRFNGANCLTEAEHVGRVGVQLELGGEVGIVNHV